MANTGVYIFVYGGYEGTLCVVCLINSVLSG